MIRNAQPSHLTCSAQSKALGVKQPLHTLLIDYYLIKIIRILQLDIKLEQLASYFLARSYYY